MRNMGLCAHKYVKIKLLTESKELTFFKCSALRRDEGGGRLSELRPPISNPLCGDVSRAVSRGTALSFGAARRSVCASQGATSV